MKRTEHEAHMGERSVSIGFQLGNLTERKHSKHQDRRLENNTKFDLKEIGWEGVGWINVAKGHGRVAGSCEDGNEESGSIKCRELLD